MILPSEQRDSAAVLCSACRWPMKRQFPVEAALGVGTFVPYYDEMLGVNIYSASQKRDELRVRGLIEAGDKEGGARMFDGKVPVGSQLRPLPLMAGADSDQLAQRGDPADIAMTIQHRDGSEERVMLKELPEPKAPSPEAAQKAFEQLRKPTKPARA